MSIRTAISRVLRCLSISLTQCFILRAKDIFPTEFCVPSRTDTAQLMKSAFSRWRITDSARLKTRPRWWFRADRRTHQARALPVLWRARARFLPRFRHLSVRRATVIRDAWRTALIITGLRCLPPFSRKERDFSWATAIFISMLSADWSWTSLLPTFRLRLRLSQVSRIRPFVTMLLHSAR